MGVRGIALADGDKVISLSILRHVEATADERAAYLKRANAVRRGLEPRRRRTNGDATGEEADRARSSSASSAMWTCRPPSSSC